MNSSNPQPSGSFEKMEGCPDCVRFRMMCLQPWIIIAVSYINGASTLGVKNPATTYALKQSS